METAHAILFCMGRFFLNFNFNMWPMRNITPSQNKKPISQSAPQKCIQFILDYSKSYQVVEVSGTKIGLNLN